MRRKVIGALVAPLMWSSMVLAGEAVPTVKTNRLQRTEIGPVAQTTQTTTIQEEQVTPQGQSVTTQTTTTETEEVAPVRQETVVVEPAPAAVAEPESRNKWFDTQMGLVLGGGVANYTSGGLDRTTGTGGAWNVRFILGAHSPIGVELGYVGTANSIDNPVAEGIGRGATILSNGFEGNVRLATPAWRRIPVQLYGFIGAGLARFDLMIDNATNTALRKVDTTFVLPFGGGLQFNLSEHILLDGRFTYRTMFDEGLLSRDSSNDMYTATAQIGFLF